MTTLFSPNELRVKPQRPRRDKQRRRLPTGSPRLMESGAERLVRLDAETWATLITEIRRSAHTRLEMLHARDGNDQVPCPWACVVSCDGGCRCGGAKVVTVDFLRSHYAGLALAIVQLARRASS